MAICLLGENELTARLDPGVLLERGTLVPLTFDAGNLHLFEPETGVRIPFRA
jgi:multiple sugar transport system ATP-binding protein